MKRILLLLMVVTVMATFNLPAQETAALEERIKQLNGYVQDLLEDKANQKKQIEALGRELQSLREQVQNQPKGNFASQEDLRALARQVQEIENNRKADYEKIANQIENLGKAQARPVASRPKPGASRADLPEKAAEHTIASGDTPSTIAAAYSKEFNVKITSDLILKANPGLDPLKLKVGQKILVPIPEK